MENKNAIISGGNRGIGRGIALELAEAGVNIAFSYHSNKEGAEQLAAELGQKKIKAKAFQVDIRDYDAVGNWVKTAKEFLGGLDIVVNNAGIINDKALLFMERSEWQNVLDTNLGGVFNLTRAAITGLLKQRSGSIINITSVTGVTGQASQTNYAASKAGIIGFTKSLAKETGKYNVRVNSVAPGYIETDMVKGLKENYKEQVLNKIPLGRFGTTQEIAKAVRFLAGDEAGYITGQTIIIDGGLSIT